LPESICQPPSRVKLRSFWPRWGGNRASFKGPFSKRKRHSDIFIIESTPAAKGIGLRRRNHQQSVLILAYEKRVVRLRALNWTASVSAADEYAGANPGEV
jgi:hypothetical protein